MCLQYVVHYKALKEALMRGNVDVASLCGRTLGLAFLMPTALDLGQKTNCLANGEFHIFYSHSFCDKSVLSFFQFIDNKIVEGFNLYVILQSLPATSGLMRAPPSRPSRPPAANTPSPDPLSLSSRPPPPRPHPQSAAQQPLSRSSRSKTTKG